jgi:hypothetical protein
MMILNDLTDRPAFDLSIWRFFFKPKPLLRV